MKLYEVPCTAVRQDIDFWEQAPVPALSSWFAVHVKSRHEFIAFNELCEKSIDAFLPFANRVSQWKDRKKIVKYPLFPGYMFVQISPRPEDFLSVLRTRGVVNFISLEPGKPTPVVPEEIISLRLLIESGKEINVYPHLKEGSRVRIKSGPLKNAEGILLRKAGEYQFLVNVELLGRCVSIKISAQEIETLY